MVPLAFAAVCAVLWGAADYFGGKASQRAAALRVTVVSQLCAVPVLLIGLVVVPGVPRAADLAWGVAAGFAGFAGIALLYGALAGGAMAVVAPVTAVTAAVVPLGVGLVVDRFPGPWALAGVACAIVAIALVSASGPGGAVSRRVLGRALLAGAMIGVFTSMLGQVSPEAGLWPLAAVRTSSMAVGALLVLRARESFRPPRGAALMVAAGGVLDVTATAFYVTAAARGHLSVVAAIASLYPASTVLLALLVDRERLRPHQIAGLGLAAAALVLAGA
jgi:uncharacterized membrane protein